MIDRELERLKRAQRKRIKELQAEYRAALEVEDEYTASLACADLPVAMSLARLVHKRKP